MVHPVWEQEKHYVDIDRIMAESFHYCADAPKLNGELLTHLCTLEREIRKKFKNAKIVLTSTHRKHWGEEYSHGSMGKSQHHGNGVISNAADFYFTVYRGDHCKDHRSYKEIVAITEKWLKASGLWGRIGIGIYVGNDKYGNFIIHLDLRGVPGGSWAFVNDKQVTYTKGIRALHKILESCR